MNDRDVIINLREVFRAELGVEITDENTNLFSPPYSLTPRDMAGVFIAVKEHFDIDLNSIIPRINNFTIVQIASALSNTNA